MSLAERFRGLLGIHTTSKWIVLAAIVGLAAGLGAVAFQLLSQAIMTGTLGHLGGYSAPEPMGEHQWISYDGGGFSIWLVALIVVCGGVLSGLLVHWLAPLAAGTGTDHAIDAFHNKGGKIPGRVPFVKLVASALTIGTGGSAGREGPIAQIGAGMGSFLAGALKLSVRDRRVMMAAGMGAGVAAIFRVPLAGALFASEILYHDADFETDVLVPAAISSMVAYSVYCLFLPETAQFVKIFGPDLPYKVGVRDMIPLTVLALILTFTGWLMVQTQRLARELIAKLPIYHGLRPGVGALLTATLAVILYLSVDQASSQRVLAVLSSGNGLIQLSLDDISQFSVTLLLLIGLGKILTTSFTIGSGGSGGLFGPSLVIGACMGGATALFLRDLWPAAVPHPEAYILIGMAGFFAGAAGAPFSTIIMVWEMTGHQQLLLGAMWVAMLCFMLSRRWPLYPSQVANRLQSPAHRGDFIVDILEGIRVADVYQPIDGQLHCFHQSATLDEIVHALAETPQDYFPVHDSQDKMLGIFTSRDVRAYLYDETIWSLTIARDIMVSRYLSVVPDDDLHTALQRFTERNIEELPVMDPGQPGKLLGMLRRKEAIAVYNQRLAEINRTRKQELEGTVS